jgi:hypothetical protein
MDRLEKMGKEKMSEGKIFKKALQSSIIKINSPFRFCKWKILIGQNLTDSVVASGPHN